LKNKYYIFIVTALASFSVLSNGSELNVDGEQTPSETSGAADYPGADMSEPGVYSQMSVDQKLAHFLEKYTKDSFPLSNAQYPEVENRTFARALNAYIESIVQPAPQRQNSSAEAELTTAPAGTISDSPKAINTIRPCRSEKCSTFIFQPPCRPTIIPATISMKSAPSLHLA
jgi:hypothetical protein